MGALRLYGGVIFVTTLSLFHLFRNSQHPQKEMWMHQELLVADILKFTENDPQKTSLIVLT